jgi:hypothetical protein
MKLCVSSSRCESCPAKGEPARAGSQPCAGARNAPGDASAGARVGHGACGPETSHLPGGPGSGFTCRQQPSPASIAGRGGGGSRRGVRPGHGRRGRPRNLGGPRLSSTYPGLAESRCPVSDARPVAGARVVGLQGTEEAPAAREAMGKGNRSRGRRRQGVGGRHTSEDVGEQGPPWTRPSTGGPCRGALPEGPMSNALTWHAMSPGLRKVVGRESPRATLAEEPDAGNPLVRIWRGAELGNRSAYSTSHFSREPTRQRLPVSRPCPPWRSPQPPLPASGW